MNKISIVLFSCIALVTISCKSVDSRVDREALDNRERGVASESGAFCTEKAAIIDSVSTKDDAKLRYAMDKIEHMNVFQKKMCSRAANKTLNYATEWGHTNSVSTMLEYSFIDVNHRQLVYSITSGARSLGPPLLLATEKGHKEIVKMLLAHPDIDVNKESGGTTPLMAAAFFVRTEIVSMLLAHPDIDLTITNKPGETAFDIASEQGHTEIARMLREHEGKK